MHLSVRHFALATVVSLAPLAAQAADYTLQEVRVHGRVADTVTAISHGGINWRLVHRQQGRPSWLPVEQWRCHRFAPSHLLSGRALRTILDHG